MLARERTRGWSVVALALLAGGPGALAAQDRTAPPRAARPEPLRECQCGDGNGDGDRRCFCIRLPDRSDFAGLPGMGRRAVLGVNVRQDQPARYDGEGARLYGVDGDGPAGKAGLEEGDVLVEVDGRSLLEPLADARDEARLSRERSLPVQRLLAVLGGHEAGDSVAIGYQRGGSRRTAVVVMERPHGPPRLGVAGGEPGFAPGEPMRPGDPFPPPGSGFTLDGFGAAIGGRSNVCPGRGDADGARGRVAVWLGRDCVGGVELLAMQPELAEYFGAEGGGVLVTDADAGNPLGLEPGDVLLAVDGRVITGVDRALRVLRSYEGGEEVALEVLRRRERLELRGKMPR